MTSATEELKEVTKLVLYGWGYPAVFKTSEGQPLQNRMVRFPLDTAPAIEGVNTAAFRPIRAKLELIKASYLDTITCHSGINPFWVWIDTPTLTEEEITSYRQQFMNWASQRGLSDREINRVTTDWSRFVPQSMQNFIAQALKTAGYWKQAVLAIGLIIALFIAHLLAVPVTACSPEAINIGTGECVDAIGLSLESVEPDLPELPGNPSLSSRPVHP